MDRLNLLKGAIKPMGFQVIFGMIQPGENVIWNDLEIESVLI